MMTFSCFKGENSFVIHHFEIFILLNMTAKTAEILKLVDEKAVPSFKPRNNQFFKTFIRGDVRVVLVML